MAEFDPDRIKTEAFRDNPRLSRVRRYCEDNPGERISLVDAARVANLEASYFSSFFHEKTGVCFHSWLNYTRVLRAMHSLADTELSITTVSRKVGFRDLRTFQRAFKRFASVTPTDYRKQARAEEAARAARTPVSATHRVTRPTPVRAAAEAAAGSPVGTAHHGNGTRQAGTGDPRGNGSRIAASDEAIASPGRGGGTGANRDGGSARSAARAAAGSGREGRQEV